MINSNRKKNMFSLRRKVLYFALVSRIFVIGLSATSNFLVPDHDANVFISPSDPGDTNTSTCDLIIKHLLGGLVRWDGQYFLHIVLYGYTYENCLAFFPLFPILVRILASVLYYPLHNFISNYSLVLISFSLINIFSFVKAAVLLFELSLSILRDKQLAYISAILFCINPASIFFSAPYSESLYAYLTFFGMLKCGCGLNSSFNIACGLPFGLAAGTRSNGILNIGFIIYKTLKSFVTHIFVGPIAMEIKSKFGVFKWMCKITFAIIIFLIPLLSALLLSLALFILFQVYAYQKFCFYHAHNLPDFIVDFAKVSNLILPGVKNSSWCNITLPLSYSYVQSHYWDVGFLHYYQWKQIPNFMLALPIVFIVLSQSYKFFKQHFKSLLTFGLTLMKPKEAVNGFPDELFVYICHISFLTIFCLLNIHVQVTTRMVCSASPVLYWFGAYMLTEKKGKDAKKIEDKRYRYIAEQQIESHENLESVWKVFLFTDRSLHDCTHEFIKYYFLAYMIIGTILFSNFYPWT